MIKLRELKEKDAPLMYEWMHDSDIYKYFKRNLNDTTIDDVLNFIKESKIAPVLKEGASIHYAIVDSSTDEYIGTISLKDIDLDNKRAEYSIVTRKSFRGKGIGYEATNQILHKAFFDLDLRRVYLNVYSNNIYAIKLYEKCGFTFEGEFRNHFIINGEPVGWKWYGILKEEFKED